MGLSITKIAQVTAAVGYDLLVGQIHQISAVHRGLQGLSLVGSAVLSDCRVDFYIDTVKVAELYNSRAGVVSPNNDDIIPMDNLFIPAGAALHAIVVTAPTTNPVLIAVKTANV